MAMSYGSDADGDRRLLSERGSRATADASFLHEHSTIIESIKCRICMVY
jgi:hypothetical protein